MRNHRYALFYEYCCEVWNSQGSALMCTLLWDIGKTITFSCLRIHFFIYSVRAIIWIHGRINNVQEKKVKWKIEEICKHFTTSYLILVFWGWKTCSHNTKQHNPNIAQQPTILCMLTTTVSFSFPYIFRFLFLFHFYFCVTSLDKWYEWE